MNKIVRKNVNPMFTWGGYKQHICLYKKRNNNYDDESLRN